MKIHQHIAGHMTKMSALPIYGKSTLKIFFPGITGPILMKLCMKHQRPKPFFICANYEPGLTLTYFKAWSNFANWGFTWENMTMMYSLEIIASCDLDFG